MITKIFKVNDIKWDLIYVWLDWDSPKHTFLFLLQVNIFYDSSQWFILNCLKNFWIGQLVNINFFDKLTRFLAFLSICPSHRLIQYFYYLKGSNFRRNWFLRVINYFVGINFRELKTRNFFVKTNFCSLLIFTLLWEPQKLSFLTKITVAKMSMKNFCPDVFSQNKLPGTSRAFNFTNYTKERENSEILPGKINFLRVRYLSLLWDEYCHVFRSCS